MLKTIQMQKAKPTQKQNKKPTHNAGKITKKKLKKPRFIGGAKKNISELSIKEKLEFLKHCLNNTIHGDLRGILYTANEKALKYFPTYEVGYIDMFKIVIKYVLLCLINNSTNSDYKDITRSNNCYLLLKNKCPYKRCQYSIDFESEKYLDSKEEEELNKIADQYYDTFKNYVSEIVKKPHDNKTINKYIKDIYPGGIAILTKKSDNDKYDLKINNSETPIEEYSKIIDFLKKNTNTKFLIILKKESSNTDETDVYNCMMQIIMKLVDIFSSENNSKYYEMIIKGKDENAVYLSMNEDASRESLTVAQEERLKEQANQTNKETEQNQGIHKVEIAKTPETPETAAKIEAQTAEAKAQTTAEAAAAAAKIIRESQPDINLDKLLNYIFNDDNTKQLDLQRQAILLKSLKMICYNKLYKLHGRNFNKEIDNKYTAIINKPKEKINEIIKESIYTYALPELRCNSSEMIEAYQHIINILVPKHGLDITKECYETLIALSYGMTDNNCKKTIGDILTQKNYLLSEPKIKDLLIRKYLKDLGNLEGIAIEELKNFKQNVLEILNEILDVPAYKETQSKVLTIYKSLHDIIVTDYSNYTDLANVLFGNIITAYHGTKKDITYPDIQKTPEEIKFDELLDIVFNKIKIDIGNNIMPTFTEHSILLKSLKLVSYNKLNTFFADFNDKIYKKYIDKMEAQPLILRLSKNEKDFIKEQSTIAITSFRRQCSTEEMVEAYQHIINIIDKEIDSQSQILLENLSLGAKDPDCKSTIRKIVKNKSYLLSKPNMMRKEIDIYFLNDENFRTKYEDSSENPEVTLKKYYDLIDTSNKDTNFPYDIKSKLLNDYEKIRAKIIKKHIDKSFLYELHYISPPLKPKK